MYIAGLFRLFPVQIRRALVQNFLLGSVKFIIYATQNQNITTIMAKNISDGGHYFVDNVISIASLTSGEEAWILSRRTEYY